jgi:hypothetical protein
VHENRTIHGGQTEAQAGGVQAWDDDVRAAAACLGPRIGLLGLFGSSRVRLRTFRAVRALAKDACVVVNFDLSQRQMKHCESCMSA